MNVHQLISLFSQGWKRFLPKSLFVRCLLIIIVPTILIQIIATYVFYERHWSSMARNLSASLAGEIATIVKVQETATPEEANEVFGITSYYMGLGIRVLPKTDFLPNSVYPSATIEMLASALKVRFFYPFSLHYTKWLYSDVRLLIGLPNANMEIIIPSKRLENPTTYIFMLWMVGSALLLLAVSIVFLKNQIRAIQRLAIAADKFGKGQDLKNFRPSGALEVRKTAAALILMKERIARQVAQRTEMLAAISHDLRTPLTRMKLILALLSKKMDDAETIGRLEEDIHDMERMVESYLLFAKGEGSEKPVQVKWSAMIAKWVGGYDLHGHHIELKEESEGYITLRYAAFKRALTNIVNNALRHGTTLRVTTRCDETRAVVTIEDNGPGIPEEKREEAFRPFVRLDAARNLDISGNGLGLTIARDIVLGHGGEITLGTSRLGGLKVTITLPV